MSIVTKRGDGGKSFWRDRVADKDSPLLEAIGAIDELMAVAGVVMMRFKKKGVALAKINKTLYKISALLAGYEVEVDLGEEVAEMEKEIEEKEKMLGPISKFLEAGGELNVWMNWTRVLARRVERRVVTLSKSQKIDPRILVYFNRLSDYLFVLARR